MGLERQAGLSFPNSLGGHEKEWNLSSGQEHKPDGCLFTGALSGYTVGMGRHDLERPTGKMQLDSVRSW